MDVLPKLDFHGYCFPGLIVLLARYNQRFVCFMGFDTEDLP